MVQNDGRLSMSPCYKADSLDGAAGLGRFSSDTVADPSKVRCPFAGG